MEVTEVVVNLLHSAKAPGIDKIQPEMLKALCVEGLKVDTAIQHCGEKSGTGPPGETVGGAAGVFGDGVTPQGHPISVFPKRELCLRSRHQVSFVPGGCWPPPGLCFVTNPVCDIHGLEQSVRRLG